MTTEITNGAQFIKQGNNIRVKPGGLDYDLISGKVYDLHWDDWKSTYIFSENGELNLPKKVYELKKDVIFKKRVLKYFEDAPTQTTGIMLAGTKGTGKTVLAKVLAKESKLPIIVVGSDYPARKLNDFFKEFNVPVCVIFDEVEKNWNTNQMLEFLDGIQATAKKLVIMTCNNLDMVSEYMQDRCSRIRYLRRYTPSDNIEIIASVVADSGVRNVAKVTEFIIKNIKLLSIDNIISFINEVKLLEDDETITLEDIIEIMNISTRLVSKEKSDEERIAQTIADVTGKTLEQSLLEVKNTFNGAPSDDTSSTESIGYISNDFDNDSDDNEDDEYDEDDEYTEDDE